MSAEIMSKKMQLKKDVLVREVAGEWVILTLESESYMGLDEIGTRIGVVLLESDTIGQGVETLLEEYDVEREVLEKDVAYVVGKLQEDGVVELVTP